MPRLHCVEKIAVRTPHSRQGTRGSTPRATPSLSVGCRRGGLKPLLDGLITDL